MLSQSFFGNDERTANHRGLPVNHWRLKHLEQWKRNVKRATAASNAGIGAFASEVQTFCRRLWQ